MTAPIPMPRIERSAGQEQRIDEAELAAAAFLARYQGRTLDAYRYDLRAYFQWAADEGLVILSATRPQVELYVRALECRGLAATTIDRRLSTVCGFYRFAHIDGRIASNRAQYVRRPKVHPNETFDRQAGRPRPRAPPHAACGVHHVRPRGRGSAARSADRRPSRRPADYDGL